MFRLERKTLLHQALDYYRAPHSICSDAQAKVLLTGSRF